MGAIFVQMPPGERKSGMPLSVEIPAPVKTTARQEARSITASSAARVCVNASVVDGATIRRDPMTRECVVHVHGMALRRPVERHAAGVTGVAAVGDSDMHLACHLSARAHH